MFHPWPFGPSPAAAAQPPRPDRSALDGLGLGEEGPLCHGPAAGGNSKRAGGHVEGFALLGRLRVVVQQPRLLSGGGAGLRCC